jgi:hypothetical protein
MDDQYPEPEYPEVVPVHRRPDSLDNAGMRLILPVNVSGWAIASGYLGLISVLCLPAPFALLTGILAIRDIRRNPKTHGMGRAIFGIIMGSLGLVGLVAGLITILGNMTRGR